MWQGSAGDRRPYADQKGFLETWTGRQANTGDQIAGMNRPGDECQPECVHHDRATGPGCRAWRSHPGSGDEPAGLASRAAAVLHFYTGIVVTKVTVKRGRPPGPCMPCGWRCEAKLTQAKMRAHFTRRPKRPAIPADVRRAKKSSVPVHGDPSNPPERARLALCNGRGGGEGAGSHRGGLLAAG